MKLETILDAMEDAGEGIELRGDWASLARKRDRQYRAFRARILRMDTEKDKRIAELEQWVNDNAALVHVHKRSNQ